MGLSIPRTNARALDQTIKALKAGGRIEEPDSALVQFARHLAKVLDGQGMKPNGQIARVYLDTLEGLHGGDDDDADLVSLVAAFAEVGDTPS